MTDTRIAATLILVSLAISGRGATLPAPVTLAECVTSSLVDDPSSCALSGNTAFASGSLTTFPFVSLTAQTSTGPINPFFDPGAGVIVIVTYSFQINGGNPGDVVPIMVSTNLTANGSSFSHANGFAEAVVHTSFGNASEVVCSNGLCGTTNQSFSRTFSWFALSGESGDTMHLEIEAQSGDSPLAESANASADPFIFIDPSFAGAANYSVEVSPGIGNAAPSTAPEPATLWGAGAALAILALRHCKAK